MSPCSEEARQLIRTLGLQTHPEGGYFRETYRAPDRIARSGLPERYGGARAFSTSIYFLLRGGDVSRFHRLASDECWHFHRGAPLLVHVIEPGGSYRCIRLGDPKARKPVFQAVVPRGCWFGATVADSGEYTLVGCTVAPGFEFKDFELATCVDLMQLCPQKAALIRRLTRGA